MRGIPGAAVALCFMKTLIRCSRGTEDCLGHENCTRISYPQLQSSRRTFNCSHTYIKGKLKSHADKSGAKLKLVFLWNLLLQDLPGTQECRKTQNLNTVCSHQILYWFWSDHKCLIISSLNFIKKTKRIYPPVHLSSNKTSMLIYVCLEEVRRRLSICKES